MSVKFKGALRKMMVDLQTPVRYQLEFSDQLLCLNDWLGNMIKIESLGEIDCIHCGRRTRKSFNQGFCYPCFRDLAQCDVCIVSPEKCHYHLGSCREPEWGAAHCMRPHIVYFANSSGVKVGITRESQLPTRWIDQGAVQALAVLRVPTRYVAGLVEVAFKQAVNDKTNWRVMLRNEVTKVDLCREFEIHWPDIKETLNDRVLADLEWIAKSDAIVDIDYPALRYPQKVVSLNLDKQPVVEGRLEGIKGQYLILDSGVINIRKYAGYRVNLELNES